MNNCNKEAMQQLGYQNFSLKKITWQSCKVVIISVGYYSYPIFLALILLMRFLREFLFNSFAGGDMKRDNNNNNSNSALFKVNRFCFSPLKFDKTYYHHPSIHPSFHPFLIQQTTTSIASR